MISSLLFLFCSSPYAAIDNHSEAVIKVDMSTTRLFLKADGTLWGPRYLIDDDPHFKYGTFILLATEITDIATNSNIYLTRRDGSIWSIPPRNPENIQCLAKSGSHVRIFIPRIGNLGYILYENGELWSSGKVTPRGFICSIEEGRPTLLLKNVRTAGTSISFSWAVTNSNQLYLWGYNDLDEISAWNPLRKSTNLCTPLLFRENVKKYLLMGWSFLSGILAGPFYV